MTVSLPMYDLPEVREATDDWWSGLAKAFRAERLAGIPGKLTRSDDMARLWGAPGLVFSQTCGYPLTHQWAGRLRVLATPSYDVPGCREAFYSSLIIVREKSGIRELEELRGKIAAFNAPDSLSGWLALRLVFGRLEGEEEFFGRWRETGSHLSSMAEVQNGGADVCAIDAVTFALAKRYRPVSVEGLAEIARSPIAPALPYVTSPARPDDDVLRMRAGLASAIADSALATIRDALFLTGIRVLDDAAYNAVLELEGKLKTT